MNNVQMKTGGQYMAVQSFDEQLELCAVAYKPSSVQLYCRERNTEIQTAFRFRHENDDFFLKAEGKHLMLEKVAGGDANLPDSHWFVRENLGGSGYGLRPVAEPRCYVCMSNRVFCLSESRQRAAMVTHKKTH